MSTLPPMSTALVLALVAVAGIYDLRFRRIPNWLTISGILAGFIANGVAAHVHGLAIAALGLGVAIAIYLPLYLLRAMGAGDVKLMAAVGALAGPANWLCIFLVTALVGGVAALCLVAFRGQLYQTLFNVQTILSELARFQAPYQADPILDVRQKAANRMPHGVSIALGTMLFLFALQTDWHYTIF